MKKTFVIGTLILCLGTQCWGSEVIKNELKALSNKLSGRTSASSLIPSIKVYKDNIIEPSATHTKDITGTNYKYSLKTVSKYLSSNKEGLKYANIVEFKMPKTFEYDEVNETKIWKRGNKVIKVVSLIHDVNYHTGEIGIFDPDDGSKLGIIYGEKIFDPVTEKIQVVNKETGRIYYDKKIYVNVKYDRSTNTFDFYDVGEYSAKWLGEAEGVIKYDTINMTKHVLKPNGEAYEDRALWAEIVDRSTGKTIDCELNETVETIPITYVIHSKVMTVEYFRETGEPYTYKTAEIKIEPTTGKYAWYDHTIFLEYVE